MQARTAPTRVPLDIGAIHFIGIGGIGMSGIAEIMHNLGYDVQGSDVSDSANVRRLRGLGIPVAIGHSAENLRDARAVVYSSAVKPGNAEFDAARLRGLPLVRRAEMLAEIMRLKWCVAVAGTNGKTTTTTMVAALLDAGGLDPTVVNGGIINAYGTNARLGEGDWVVVEADESDGTFLRLPATVSVVTNVDPDHLDFYGSFEKMREAFVQFVEHVPFYGFAVLCLDHPEVQAMVGQVQDRRLITYGFSPQADVRAVNVRFSEGASHFDVIVTDRPTARETRIEKMRLPMPGEHNVQNALAAIVVARELGVSDDTIRIAFANFGGVGRRFTRVGEWNGAAIIDDYAHNPFKIAAALKAARQAYSGPIVAVVQPHRYTRLRDTFEQFSTCLNDADVAIIAPVYPAGEKPIPGIDRDTYVESLRAHGHRHVRVIEGAEELTEAVADVMKPGGAVVCLGAGSITAWAAGLEAALKKREGKA
ncbi:MAG: UDP-N-acetylmuramate--L-alanine ligase [Alphaproteobacteria bacterium]|nr:UDP-N-acetylmuramate--L-alanine ligase [Alphaproteobacteria bacterium]MDE2012386.1 UDP-N-acetylmuramate--L-alanine ligase [Alphaproteobacteria bacterium]MDE2073114.1 UDP-N-acetylmuramate--L-alanine ligase [Alphaproteobacteria bacterium]MDE2353195.1 UDP-N-acetylmuramate--L-alanine ligase [Alphaproteobacteria bacterium]